MTMTEKLISLLARLRILRPSVETLDRLRNGRAHRLIADDFRQRRDLYSALGRDLPPGDPDRIAMVVSSIGTVGAIKLDVVMSYAFRMAGYRVQPVSGIRAWSAWSRRYHRAAGHCKPIDLFLRYIYNETLPLPTTEMLDWQDNPDAGTPELIKITYRDVDAGRIALSKLLYRHRFAHIDVRHPATRAEIIVGLRRVARNVHAAERLLDETRPVILYLMEKGLPPIAELFGAAIARGIPTVQMTNSQGASDFILKRISMKNRHEHPFSLDSSTWEAVKRMPWTEENEAALMRQLRAAYVEGSWFNRKYLHQDKRIKVAEEVRAQLGLDPAKKTAVIFSHVLWDATFFYGEGLFDDYETWLIETARAASRNKAVNWVIKLHPDLVWKLRLAGHDGPLRDTQVIRDALGGIPKHITLVLPETDISTYSFFEITDYALTVRGTIGIEMACHGVPVITAGTGRYSRLGFTLDSTSTAEYLNRVASIQSIPPMDAATRTLARRYAHALFNLRPWPLRSFELANRPLVEVKHPLANDLQARIGEAQPFRQAQDIKNWVDWIQSGEVDYWQKP